MWQMRNGGPLRPPSLFLPKSRLATTSPLRYVIRMIESLEKPEVILTHESDLDGLLSGVLLQRLAKKLFGVDVPLQAYHYNHWRQREMRERSAWVADFSFEPRLDRLNWVVIDHHTTEAVAKNAYFVHDLNKSAGLLCYELCKEHEIQSPELDRLVRLNNVADLFLEDDPEFVLAGDYANLVKTYQFWNLHALLGGHIEKLLDHPLLEVMAVKRRLEDPLGLAWARENVVEVGPGVGFVDTVIGNNNLIVHQMLESGATKYPVLVTLFRRGNGAMIASFRSRNGEALAIAGKFQGGGHANACAASLPRSVKTIDDGVSYLRQVLCPKRPDAVGSLESLFDALGK